MTSPASRPQTPGLAGPRRPAARGSVLGVRAGQIVAAQTAAAGLVAAAGRGPVAIAAAGLAAVVLVGVAWLRPRDRWLYQWMGVWVRYASGRHVLAPNADATALLDFVAPGARVEPAELAGDVAAVLVDGLGLTAVLELGEPAGLLSGGMGLPTPTSLLPATARDAPRARVQLVVACVPAPTPRAGGGPAATSYRQLTEGRLLSQEQVLLTVRVLRGEGWAEDDLLRALSGLIRKIRRRLGGTPVRPLGAAALPRVIADLAHHDGVQPIREAWNGLRVGGLPQVTFRLSRWPDLRSETARRLVPRLLALPAAATTVTVTAGPREPTDGDDVPVDLAVRIASGDAAGMTASVRALHELMAAENAAARRLDGEHLDGFAATLPLGGADPPAFPGFASDGPAHRGALTGLELPVGSAGLMLGRDRRGQPVLARLFRAKPTRAVFGGALGGAQIVVLRAMALGARVLVQTARPQAWEPFIRGAGSPGETVALVPAGRPIAPPPAGPLHPVLLVIDVGPAGGDAAIGGWQASLVVRDDLGPLDVDTLARADLVIMQSLRPAEAALAEASLGLGEAAEWLTRIRADMVGVVNRRAVRWALLSPTPIELHLAGPPARG